MSYKCQLCRTPVPPKTPKRRHAEYRPDGSIEREWDVCGSCAHALRGGASVSFLQYVNRPRSATPSVPALVAAATVPATPAFTPPAPTLAAGLVERWRGRAVGDLGTKTPGGR